METLWFFLMAPARLLSVLWPLFIMPPVFGVFAALLRASVLRRVEATRVHPIVRSRFGWPLAVALGTLVLLWLTVSAAMFVLILAAQAAMGVEVDRGVSGNWKTAVDLLLSP
jgi:hypothetical protein